MVIQRVLTDNAKAYAESVVFAETAAGLGIRLKRTRRYRPQTNGKVERFNRTLLEEWAYRRLYPSNAARDRALQPWVHTYNGTVALSQNVLAKPSKVEALLHGRRQERAEPLDRAHDLSSLSGEMEAVARGDRSMQQCPPNRRPNMKPRVCIASPGARPEANHGAYPHQEQH